jgi:RNA polymerase sigma factor (sigma-70 family)
MSQEAALADPDLYFQPNASGIDRPAPTLDPVNATGLSQEFARATPPCFDELVAAHQAHVTRLAHRLLAWRSGIDLEDVVQEVFLAAFIHRSRFRGRASLSTWLTAITINRCRSHQRRWRLWWKWVARQPKADPASRAPPLEQGLDAKERGAKVRAAVQRLPPRDREVIVLRYFEGLSPPDIATLTRQSKNAVEVRLHRARGKLAEALGPWVREEQS